MAIDVARVHFPARRAVAWLAERYAVPSPVCCLEESVGREGEKRFLSSQRGDSPRIESVSAPQSRIGRYPRPQGSDRTKKKKDDKARLCP